MFIPLRIEATSIMEALLLGIYVLFVPLRKGHADCAQPWAQGLSLLTPHPAGVSDHSNPVGSFLIKES